MSDPADPPKADFVPGRTRRRFRILIAAALAVVVLWSGGWFVVRHYAAGKLDAIGAMASAEGATLACGDQSLSGFPFRIGVTCTPLAAACPADEVSLKLAGIEALAMLYNPRQALLAAKGPMTLDGPGGATLDADWSSLESSLRVSGNTLARYSVVADNLDAKLAAPGRLPAPIAASARHAELHLLPDPDKADALDVFGSVDQFAATPPGRSPLPPLTSNIELTLPGIVLTRGGNTIGPWIAAGSPVKLAALDLQMAGVAASATGDFTLSPEGLISGTLTARFDSLDHLPDLAEALRPGSRDKVAKLIAPLTAFLRPVTADGKSWREATISIKRGRMTLGFIPLGTLPPVGRKPAPPPEPGKEPGGKVAVAQNGAADAVNDQAAKGGKPLVAFDAAQPLRTRRCAID